MVKCVEWPPVFIRRLTISDVCKLEVHFILQLKIVVCFNGSLVVINSHHLNKG